MKLWMTVLALALTLGFVTSAQAAKGDKKGLRGKITSIDGKNIVVSKGAKAGGGDTTIMTDDNTSVTIDGKKATVADLKPGLFVMVTPADGTASTITATTTRPQGKKAATEPSKIDDSSK